MKFATVLKDVHHQIHQEKSAKETVMMELIVQLIHVTF
jgi:hypothetical protein